MWLLKIPVHVDISERMVSLHDYDSVGSARSNRTCRHTITAFARYTFPDNPADPEAAALEPIVRMPSSISPSLTEATEAAGLTEILQDYCGVLHAEGAFAGLSWADAKTIAAAVAFDAVTRDDAADFLRNRARNALSGVDNMAWVDRQGRGTGVEHRRDGADSLSRVPVVVR
jgi:hypothetical protein